MNGLAKFSRKPVSGNPQNKRHQILSPPPSSAYRFSTVPQSKPIRAQLASPARKPNATSTLMITWRIISLENSSRKQIAEKDNCKSPRRSRTTGYVSITV